MDERALVKKLNRGSRSALDAAVKRFTPYVSAVILRALAGRACREDVEELCADVFVALWANAPGLDPVVLEDSIAGSVTLNRITLSPLSLRAEFTSPDDSPPIPLLHFLWKDGSVSPARQLGIRGGASGYRHVGAGELWQLDETWTLNSIQDLSQMEAVVFGGMAYPLDGGAPCPVDVDTLPLRELKP